MEKIKHIALVAHDNRKKDLIEWVEWNHKPLLQHQLICTGTTGRMIENALKWMALFTIILTGGCTAPHYIWPQKDIGFYEINPPALGKRVLIASRDSEFKRALVDRLVAAYTDQPVYLRIIGIEALTDEDANQFSAVVLINTCMGWTVDVEVERFLEKYGELASIIVLTTSDGGDVLPDMENRNIDAISSASVKDRVQPLAAMMIGKIDRLIQ